ncbi:translation initiation factor EIF-2B, putative [Babesia ovis]|uniref:Translation initiation factor EIF-2B, putative n=1 Tax=Babesia ovis TaxID=5869 RepID=A0A9W5TD98_BABOV|nr:translation initiation factor EIF-2B, putative [Babesia ovis]
MPISHCCHLISSIELRYSADTRLPSSVLRAFKHPRVYDNDGNATATAAPSRDSLDSSNALIDEVTRCNRILQSHGYRLIDQNKDGFVKIQKIGFPDRNYKRSRDELDQQDNSQSLTNVENSEDGLSRILDIARKAMVYHICLYDDNSLDAENPTTRLSQGSREPYKIRKNSTYEMLYGLNDCLIQLRKKSCEQMEAILITEEYSGIFTNEEIVITRSTMGFRDLINDEGIKYNSIYRAAATAPAKLGLSQREMSHDDIVNGYLKMPILSQSQESRLLDDSLAVVEYTQDTNTEYNENVSKETFFKALNLPISDEYDVNVMFVRGRHQCSKLLRFLEKQSQNALLKMKKSSVFAAPVKLVLTNFPVLFSKLQELRVSWDDKELGMGNTDYGIHIKGLVLPAVLNSVFKLVRRLQSQGMIREASLAISYNTDLDSELHEDCLQISDNNRIYKNFMANINFLEKNYQQMYSVLRKMMPYTNFVVQKGRVSVPARGALRKHGSICLPHSSSYGEFGSRSLYLSDIPRSLQHDDHSSRRNASVASDKIVVLKDTLYTNLSGIKFVIEHLEGADAIKVMPTKLLVSESLSRVISVDASDAGKYPHTLKCYIDLYPAIDYGKSHAVLQHVEPYHLTNLVWLMGYLLHSGAYLPLFDRHFIPENVTENMSEKSFTHISISPRSNGEEFNAMFEEALLSEKFMLDLTTTGSDPLAQQSYISKLVQRLSFNKRFQTVFGISFMEHSMDKLQLARSGDVKRKVSTELAISDTVDTSTQYSTQLSSSWHTLLQRSQSGALGRNSTMISDSTQATISQEDIDTQSQINNPESADEPIGFRNMFPTITSDEVVNLQLNHSDSFGSVSSTTRAHGRLHHCVFHFDTKAPFKGTNDINALQQEIENMQRAEAKQGTKVADRHHIVFVFLVPKQTRVLVSTRIKLVKDVINSSDIVFILGEQKIEESMEYNILNSKHYIDSLKKENVANKVGEYNEKCGITYSFVVGIDILDQHVFRLYQELDKDMVCHLYYISMDSDITITKELAMVDATQSLLGITRNKLPRKRIHEKFVSYSWICDSYMAGCIDLKREVNDIHCLTVNEGKLMDPYYCITLNTNDKPDIIGSLRFCAAYQHVKFLWGWSIYVLSLRNQVITDDDILLYKNHCGIRITTHGSLDSIANAISSQLESDLRQYNLTEDDVSSFLPHPRIYTNVVVLMGDPMWHPSDLEQETEHCDYKDGCLKVTFGGKVVCLGKYDGIPLVMSTWMTDTLCQSKPAPIHNYTI